MRLTMIGGGGFRVPQLYRALADDPAELVHEFVLTDTDPGRLAVVENVISQLRQGDGGPAVRTTPDVAEGITGADYVFSAVRVGGTEGRAIDEEVALSHGVLGQETVGVGGMAYALRTIPVARELARLIRAHAPEAWVINFTNPAGVITQAMRESLGDRVVGICDTPIGLVNRIADITDARVTSFEYAGLNHLGWLRGVRGRRAGSAVGETDLLAAVLADDALLSRIEEARLFGFDVVRSIGALPNEYLYYYWHEREALARISGRDSRGRQLLHQQADFYAAATASPGQARKLWEAALLEREETYGSETRDDAAARRSTREIELGGYQKVALQLMRVLAGAEPSARMVLNVRNGRDDGGRSVSQLPDDAVVEVACEVVAGGIEPAPVEPLGNDLAGLMVQIKGCDELLLAATAERDPVKALRAFATHPLVDSAEVARELLAEYCERQPLIAQAVQLPADMRAGGAEVPGRRGEPHSPASSPGHPSTMRLP
ncbi:MAG TPA: 6-phospho-beta-glucosidase [Actinomycetaceae bacterium]|nr:6-phospho-beta-glucosidase [Actinomycetaceae bacterium]